MKKDNSLKVIMDIGKAKNYLNKREISKDWKEKKRC